MIHFLFLGRVEDGEGKKSGGKGKRKSSDGMIANVISKIFRLFK